MERTAFRTCPFCEATCGLEVTLRGDEVVKVRGDGDDVFSPRLPLPEGRGAQGPARGPRPAAHAAGPRRRRRARARELGRGVGAIAERLAPDRCRARPRRRRRLHRQPAAHGLAALLYGRVLLKALGTHSVFSASTVDQRPKEIASRADVRDRRCRSRSRTSTAPTHLLMLGANPLASNGSLMTAPDMRGRLRALRARGGKLVVVDPRRTPHRRGRRRAPPDPARAPTRCCCSRSSTCSSRRASPPRPARGADRRRRRASRRSRRPFTPEAVAPVTRDPGATRSAGWRASSPPRRGGRRLRPDRHDHAGVRDARLLARRRAQRADRQPRPAGRRDVPARRRRAAQLVRARRAAAGATQLGALAQPRARAARVARRAAGRGARRGDRDAGRGPDPRADHARRQPGALDAELGPDGARRSTGSTCYVALDIYVNETTRHADVILPAPSPLERSHYDLALYQLAVRNVANYSPPVVRARPGCPTSGRRCCGSPAIAAGQGVPRRRRRRSTASGRPS